MYWPYGQSLFFIRPDGMIIHVAVENLYALFGAWIRVLQASEAGGIHVILLRFPDHIDEPSAERARRSCI